MKYIVYYFLVEGVAKLPIIKICIIQKVLHRYFLISPIQLPLSSTLVVSAFGGNSEILYFSSLLNLPSLIMSMKLFSYFHTLSSLYSSPVSTLYKEVLKVQYVPNPILVTF